MKTINFSNGYPKITKMASGNLSLELSENIFFDDFPEYASLLLSIVDGDIEKKDDSIIMCIWNVVINGRKYMLVYDDYPCSVSLESSSEESDVYLIQIKKILEAQCLNTQD